MNCHSAIRTIKVQLETTIVDGLASLQFRPAQRRVQRGGPPPIYTDV